MPNCYHSSQTTEKLSQTEDQRQPISAARATHRVVVALLGLGADSPHLDDVDLEALLAGELARLERGARGRREAAAEVGAHKQTEVLELAAEALTERERVRDSSVGVVCGVFVWFICPHSVHAARPCLHSFIRLYTLTPETPRR